MTTSSATSSAWTRIRLPAAWPSEGARQLYLAMRSDPNTNSAYHAAQRLRDIRQRDAADLPVLSPTTREITNWLHGPSSEGHNGRRPSLVSTLLIERLYPSVTPKMWREKPQATVAETVKHFEDAA